MIRLHAVATSTVLVLAAGASCATDDPGAYPVQPQGTLPPPGVSTPPGQPPPSSDVVTGRVCRATDLRAMTPCTGGNTGGLTVTLGTSTAITASDGTFSMPAPSGWDLAYEVTGAGVIPSVTPFSPSPLIQVVDAELYERMLLATGATLDPGMGAILATVRNGDVPYEGVSVASTPASAFGPYYALPDPTSWGSGAGVTGAYGMMWLPGLSAGRVDLSYQHIAGGLTTSVAGVPVRNGGVTILDLPWEAGGVL